MTASRPGALSLLSVAAAALVVGAWRAPDRAPHVAVELVQDGASRWVHAGTGPTQGLALDDGDRVRIQGDQVHVDRGMHALLFGGRLDLNQATAEQLQQLPGLGPGLAARVVESRTVEGPFDSVDALDRVSGIGPARVDQVRPYVLAGPAPAGG